MIQPGSSVLHIGCSTTLLALALREKNCRCVGIVTDPEAAETAKAHYDRIVVGNALLVLPALVDEKFDFIVLSDVLAKLSQPAELLTRLRPFLGERCEIVASLPNVTHASVACELLKGRFQYKEGGLLDFTHLRFFDRHSAIQLFQEAGYTAVIGETVMKEPQDTEFASDLAEFPSELMAVLNGNPDRLVYQFILRAVPAERIHLPVQVDELRKKLSVNENALSVKMPELEKLRKKLLESERSLSAKLSELDDLRRKFTVNASAVHDNEQLHTELESNRKRISAYKEEIHRLRSVIAGYEYWPSRLIVSVWSRLALVSSNIMTSRRELSVKHVYLSISERLRKKEEEKKLVELIGKSGLFDASFYAERNQDVVEAGIDPLKHFISFGASEGRDPHPLFDTSFYIEHNLDVAGAGTNPLAHFITNGALEGRDPHPLFDTSFYVERNSDVAEAGINPLVHFITHGASEGRDPNPYFDMSFYMKQNADVLGTGVNPLVHFITRGASEGRDPSLRFSISLFARQNPVVMMTGVNPLEYFLHHSTNNPAIGNFEEDYQSSASDSGKPDLYPVIRKLSDDEWQSLLLRSIKERRINDILMPGFPEEAVQTQFTGAINDDTINEAFNFFTIARDACSEYGAPIRRATRLLDFGCGWGRISRMFLRDISSPNIYGVDVNPVMIELCNNIMPYGNFSSVNSGSRMEFPDNHFDLVVAYSVFSHLSERNLEFWIKEITRVLAPGGIFVATTLKYEFIQQCIDAHRDPESSPLKGLDYILEHAFADVLKDTFPDVESALLAYNNEDMFFLPTGGGDYLPSSDYGWAIVPKKYVLKNWKNLELKTYMKNLPICPQAVIVVQKTDNP